MLLGGSVLSVGDFTITVIMVSPVSFSSIFKAMRQNNRLHKIHAKHINTSVSSGQNILRSKSLCNAKFLYFLHESMQGLNFKIFSTSVVFLCNYSLFHEN